MASKHCIICGYFSSRPFCSVCESTAKKYFQRITEYIRENPNPTVMEVYADTFIPLPVIYGLKDMGWLDIIPVNGQYLLTPKEERFNRRKRRS